MAKVRSRGKVIIDGKEVDLGDFDDTRASHTHNKSEDELEKETLRQALPKR